MAEPTENTNELLNSPEIQALIAEAIAKETSGLIANRDKILQEKRELADKLKDVDVEEYQTLKQEREKLKTQKLKEEGNIDELLAKQESALRADYEAKLQELGVKLNEATNTSTDYQRRLQEKTIADVIRDEAIRAGALPDAINDIVEKGIRSFRVSEAGELESRDSNGELRKDSDGFIVTPQRFVANLRKTNAYYWGGSQGAGLNGSNAVQRNDLQTKIMEAAANGDMNKYRELRAQASGKK